MLNDFGAHPADRVPKAELHAHLEGTIHAPVLRKLAARNGITLPDGVLDDFGRESMALVCIHPPILPISVS